MGKDASGKTIMGGDYTNDDLRRMETELYREQQADSKKIDVISRDLESNVKEWGNFLEVIDDPSLDNMPNDTYRGQVLAKFERNATEGLEKLNATIQEYGNYVQEINTDLKQMQERYDALPEKSSHRSGTETVAEARIETERLSLTDKIRHANNSLERCDKPLEEMQKLFDDCTKKLEPLRKKTEHFKEHGTLQNFKENESFAVPETPESRRRDRGASDNIGKHSTSKVEGRDAAKKEADEVKKERPEKSHSSMPRKIISTIKDKVTGRDR